VLHQQCVKFRGVSEPQLSCPSISRRSSARGLQLVVSESFWKVLLLRGLGCWKRLVSITIKFEANRGREYTQTNKGALVDSVWPAG
jgi:hypothetical protein